MQRHYGKLTDSQLLSFAEKWGNGFEIVFNQSEALIFTYYLIFDQVYRFDLFTQKKNYTSSAKNTLCAHIYTVSA